jgi:uncharacterized membrane protein
MQRIWEFIFGLRRGFLGRDGDLSLQFNPQWPWQQYTGASLWNGILVALAVALVVHVYRRDARTRKTRLALGALRLSILLLVIGLLNRPVLTLTQERTEPSVLALMVDRSVSMRVRDGGQGPNGQPMSRLEAVANLLEGNDRAVLNELAKNHEVRIYEFDDQSKLLGAVTKAAPANVTLASLKPEGESTQVVQSVRGVLDDLQGQRIAGVVLLTDGRETPERPHQGEALAALKSYNVKVFPVPLGSDQTPVNVDVQSITVQDTAFVGDIVNVKATVRATGYPSAHDVRLVLTDRKTGLPLRGANKQPVEQTARLAPGQPTEVELQFLPVDIANLDVTVEAVRESGELDDEDNVRTAQVSVLDAKINLLYVDGYPRWDYRYLKNEMIRDKTVEISCLLTSADPTFAQEGDRPITRFPESMTELLDYDVIVFGDVDPRQFTDAQLQLVSDFVSKNGGGFGMVAGPRFSPQAFRNTAIEPVLPVSVGRVDTSDPGVIQQGFRPVLTREGEAASIFRFFPDREVNAKFIKNDWQPVFWYCRGITVKPGVGEAYAEHPTDVGPDGRKAPVLVLGRFGAGRTLFSGIDDSWRWRYYTGESVFDTYWVQQVRYLARSKKLGQRRLTLTTLRPSYEVGQQVRVSLRILDPQLQQQLPEQVRADILDSSTGQLVRQETLVRQESQHDLYVASWTADRIGRFTVKLPPIASGTDPLDVPVEVTVPRLELASPQVDRTFLTRLASETLGQLIPFNEAAAKLPAIPSVARIIPIESAEPLWNAPIILILFVLLIAAEWVGRKVQGML